MGQGRIPAKIMIVGEAPGQREDDLNKPFQGKSGKLLDELLEAAGFTRDEVYITNAVKCRPPENRTPKAKEMKACLKYLDDEIAQVKPEFILLLGATALKQVLKKAGIFQLRGKVFEWRNGIKVTATFHPAAALRDPKRTGPLREDFKKFSELVNGKVIHKPALHLKLMNSMSQLPDLLSDLKQISVVGGDVETTGLDRFMDGGQINAFGIGNMNLQWIIPMGMAGSPFDYEEQKEIAQAIANAVQGKEFIGQNWKFDNLWFNERYETRFPVTFDTMLAGHLLDENDVHDLKYMARTKLGGHDYDISIDDKKAKGAVWGNCDDFIEYLGYDIYYMVGLYYHFEEKLNEDESLMKLFRRLVMRASRAYEQVEINGTYVNTKRMAEVREELNTKVRKLLRVLNRKAGGEINWNSPDQVRVVLFNKLGIKPIAKTPGGEDSTAEPSLIRMKSEHSIITDLLEYRGAHKLISGFIDGWESRLQQERYLHPSFKLNGTITGRPSCSDPNLQQVPRVKLIRSLIDAEDGWVFFEADYSQIELRIAAMLANERTMLEIFHNGGDIHRKTASLLLGIPEEDVPDEQRKSAKAVNFGFIYGMGWKKFVDYAFEKYELILTPIQSKRFRTRFFEGYHDLPDWHERQRRIVNAMGQVRTLTGRIRHLPEIYSDDRGLSSQAERNAINAPVQGFAAELTLMAMAEIHESFTTDNLRLCGTIHDALVGRVRRTHATRILRAVKRIMEHPALLDEFGIELTVPIQVEVKTGPWGTGQKLIMPIAA